MNIIPKEHIRDFIFAGNSAFTLTSKKTNVHYTYRIKQANNNNNTYFVNFNDNNKDTYAGYVKRVKDGYKYFKGNAGTLDELDEPVIALMWTVKHANDEDIENKIMIQHIGKCCKCGRPLTDPESIRLGVGPVCAKLAYSR